ncbi:DUF6177 family protein [Nocardiopsis algeriensis]|uniref:DUF6177 family protein n=1 Tax=Nocardiopsis algeriensis TaxID=1478215 RepID=UPI003B43793A
MQVRPLGGNVFQLCDGDRALAALEPPQPVHSRGEVTRLLGEEAALGLPDPCWWVEIRAAPDTAGREAAHRLADGLALRFGGNVWTSGAADFGLWEDHSLLAQARPASAHPAVEHAARRTFVVAQDRPVVPLSSWLSDALFTHAARGPGFQLLTSAASRLTHAMRTLLSLPRARWVVRGEDGEHHDGLNGMPLRWDAENGFVPIPGKGEAPGPVADFLEPPSDGEQLVVDLTVDHTVPFAPPLGRAVEIVAGHLAGTLPAGWGTSEPALASWNRECLVRLARQRAPRACRLYFSGPEGAGHAFSGVLRVAWDGERAREQVSLAVGYGSAAEIPLSGMPAMVEELAAEGVLSLLHVRRTPGRADATREPRWHGLAVPVGMAVGPDGLVRSGSRHLLSGPLEGKLVGADGRRAVWYPLAGGDGTARRRAVSVQMRHLVAVPSRR